jgi:hypothetical protein
MKMKNTNDKVVHIRHGGTIRETEKGWVILSLGKRQKIRKGAESTCRIWHDSTGEQKMLSKILSGEKFTEFDALKIFGTEQPSGKKITRWLKSMWAKSGDIYPAIQWIKESVPLDVLLSFGGGMADLETGWHWSCKLWSATTPEIVRLK